MIDTPLDAYCTTVRSADPSSKLPIDALKPPCNSNASPESFVMRPNVPSVAETATDPAAKMTLISTPRATRSSPDFAKPRSPESVSTSESAVSKPVNEKATVFAAIASEKMYDTSATASVSFS